MESSSLPFSRVLQRAYSAELFQTGTTGLDKQPDGQTSSLITFFAVFRRQRVVIDRIGQPISRATASCADPWRSPCRPRPFAAAHCSDRPFVLPVVDGAPTMLHRIVPSPSQDTKTTGESLDWTVRILLRPGDGLFYIALLGPGIVVIGHPPLPPSSAAAVVGSTLLGTGAFVSNCLARAFSATARR